MNFLENRQLLELNSLRLSARAEWYCEVTCNEELLEAVQFARDQGLEILALGEGTNLVFTGDVPGLVIRVGLTGISADHTEVTAGAGENWHRFVAGCVSRKLFGIENLALIPGTVGAAPVQNIGAYGVELADVFTKLTAVNRHTLETVELNRDDCLFSYRDSLFKQSGEWIITNVTLALSTTDLPDTSYPGIRNYLEKNRLEPDARSVFDAVVSIRKQKLPDPARQPNVGSFFMNPIVPAAMGEELRGRYQDMPIFAVEAPDDHRKLSAAWLIDQAGLKGEKIGAFQVSEQHALVIVNNADVPDVARQADLIQLVGRIRQQVLDKFGVSLAPEPRLYPPISISG